MNTQGIFAQQIAKIARPGDEIGRENKTSGPLKEQPFSEILSQSIEEKNKLVFSKHAQLRMSQRQITLTDSEFQKLDEAVVLAAGKGVSDSLVLMDSKAFIVNTKSRVIITAMGGEDLRNNVFTNIDGAVLA